VAEPPEKKRSLMGSVRSTSLMPGTPSRSRGLKRLAAPSVALTAKIVWRTAPPTLPKSPRGRSSCAARDGGVPPKRQ
jgi:hypothetical protein